MTRAKASLFDYLGDPDERRYLIAAIDGKLDGDGRLAYAELLKEQDPARAEWLRLEHALHERAASDPAPRARFNALTRTLSGDWVKILRRDLILNCGRELESEPRVRFAFVCDQRWEALAPTADPAVRHCGACHQRVYFCEQESDAEAHARAGRCIAVPRMLPSGKSRWDTRAMVGRPDPIGDWAEAIFPQKS